MDSNEHNKVIAFDTLFCTNHIQMLKVMLPYMNRQMQKSLAIYIKFLELNYVIDYFRKHPYPLFGCAQNEDSADIFKMCSELAPFCTENEKKQLEQIQNIRQGMNMYREMSQAMEMMKDFMPDASAFMNTGNNEGPDNSENDGAGGFDMMNMLMNMLTPEQKQMYEMFGGNQHAE
ncbi:MAG: hypothetical protein K2P50_15485 [Lachnospiraceae bacterium]|nr:hypothetical protein [Lachnospiraceae bacterium]